MKPTLFNKVFLGLVFFLVLFYSFWLGMDVQRGDTKEIIADAVLLGFWLFALLFFTAMDRQSRKLDQELDRELEEAEKNLHHALGDVFGEIEKDMKTRQDRRKQFTDVFKEVTGKEFTEAKTVSAKQKTQIEKRFNERTGLYAEIIAHKGGKIEVNVGNEKPATKKAPVKKPVAKKAPVVKKPVTTKKGNK
jgi:divalent metal cation (Fe/Co/Zn/Cd) transporter